MDEGTIWLFYPRSKAAQAWWAENVQEAQTLGRNFVVEHRYAPPILEGIKEAGLTVG
jgi:hypothetical protein